MHNSQKKKKKKTKKKEEKKKKEERKTFECVSVHPGLAATHHARRCIVGSFHSGGKGQVGSSKRHQQVHQNALGLQPQIKNRGTKRS
jgi:hypothetical protein